MTCAIDGCPKPADTRGWCKMHYSRWFRHGDPLIKRRSGPTHPVRGAASHAWGGGRVQRPDGYWTVRVYPPSIFYAMAQTKGYVLEHRLVMAQYLGRVLLPSETVHHINGDKADNSLANLQLRIGNHGNGVAVGCLDCGSHRVGPVPIREVA